MNNTMTYYKTIVSNKTDNMIQLYHYCKKKSALKFKTFMKKKTRSKRKTSTRCDVMTSQIPRLAGSNPGKVFKKCRNF